MLSCTTCYGGTFYGEGTAASILIAPIIRRHNDPVIGSCAFQVLEFRGRKQGENVVSMLRSVLSIFKNETSNVREQSVALTCGA